ncbi:uncharacterized protein Dwil_GK25133 [Drosophila willistoni]|uniref:Uncharacterized protein n=1 Tax=Drosophila willistoni TaxID=7260 RepID=B4NC72_DROWI|nr:uncharacterized protein LOC6648502 [Drosophila willistoni]EDW82431.1 uncharacterized protein Dwil_GK25133 [Drosophila willistoni]
MYTFLLILVLVQLMAGTQCAPSGEDISSIVHSAGLLGSYAGALSGGEALDKINFDTHSHDFGGEHLGSFGDHLSEDHFPADYGSDGGSAGVEYAEASELHAHFDHEHESEPEKPVPGIDHGKGAFSYSTLYEFKDRDEHEQHQLQHQQLEQQVEHESQLDLISHHHQDHDFDLH